MTDSKANLLTKAGFLLRSDAEILLKEKLHPWVSRGGMKLAHGLEVFDIEPAGLTVADIGASTGGFTDVLLHHGAAKVYAVDVGYGQLDAKLRQDPRVVVMEKTNARHLTAEQIPDPLDAVVCDASFISLKTVLPAAMGLVTVTSLRPLACEAESNPEPDTQSWIASSPFAPRNDGGGKGWLLALIKPQFEVGREQVGNGVITDPALHEAVCADITAWLNRQPGWQVVGLTESPITGPKGNKEFLVYAVKSTE